MQKDDGTHMDEHVVLVAIQVSANSREDAMHQIMDALPPDMPMDSIRNEIPGRIECWWIAEDDAIDGNDCDSAVFVHPGRQKDAIEVLLTNPRTQAPEMSIVGYSGITSPHNMSEHHGTRRIRMDQGYATGSRGEV